MNKRKHLNTYLVREESAGCFLLECIEFFETEDLGDGILATALNQQIWVAGYFVRNMKTVGPRYVVKDENTLGYIDPATPTVMGVMSGCILYGGHDPKNGQVAIVPGHTSLRPATAADFDFYRVSVPPDFN
jgi:hypothetical protein